MNKIYVLYHANCNDGSGAKFAAWSKFGDSATYYPVQYGKPMPDIENGSDVYIIDFSYPRADLEALRNRVAKLVVLDHHKTAAEDLKNFPGATFDMNKSGAVLAWEYFNPGVEVPELLLRVQDRDLWNWNYTDTGAITSLSMLAKDDPLKWEELSNKPFSTLLSEGEAIMRYKENETELLAKKAHVTWYRDGANSGTFGYVNSTSLQSEVCNYLLKESGDYYDPFPVDFAAAFIATTDGRVLVSLRSHKGGFDVSALAKKYGGGGHQAAAGCSMSLAEWLEFTHQPLPKPKWRRNLDAFWASLCASFKVTVKEFLPWNK